MEINRGGWGWEDNDAHGRKSNREVGKNRGGGRGIKWTHGVGGWKMETIHKYRKANTRKHEEQKRRTEKRDIHSLTHHRVQLPQTRLRQWFQPNTATGKLNAVMMPTTPTGFHCSNST